MTWANVDDLFPEHPKVLAAGGDAAWLYVCGLCFTNRNLTEGRIPKAVVPRLSDRKGPMHLAQKLVDVALWHDQGDHFTIHDWEKYNENADEVKARKEHARNAARARWSGAKKSPSSNAQPMPGAMPGASNEHPLGTCSEPDRAMPSHSSPTPHVSRSSSNHHVGVGEGAEEEEESKVKTAVRLLAERRLSARSGPPITNATAWLRSVRGEIMTDHGDELVALAAQGLSPKTMADRIAPPSVSTSPAHAKWEPTTPTGQSTPADERAQRLAELRLGTKVG